jgi:pimeloyl-ACP methyl ester carboxylesterase
MAQHIEGPLYHERMGRKGRPMIFVHPNPMDQSCWLFQMAHFSTWFRCIAIDVPGYGRSPKATEGLTLSDMAQGCWEAVDEALGANVEADADAVVLVGCSVGSSIVQQMHHLRPKQSAALVLSGTGWHPPEQNAPFVPARIEDYTREGLEFRWRYTFQDLSPAFGATPLAHYFAKIFMERNATADLDSILHQFRALGAPRAQNFYTGIQCPVLLLSGTEDGAHAGAFKLRDRIPGCEMHVMPGAGHACHMEQPWLFDERVVEFLKARGLF